MRNMYHEDINTNLVWIYDDAASIDRFRNFISGKSMDNLKV